jgi:hypothetical protein
MEHKWHEEGKNDLKVQHGSKKKTGRRKEKNPSMTKRFFFSKTLRLSLGPTQSPSQWVPGFFFSGVKRPGSKVNPSPQSRAKVKNEVYLPPRPPLCLHSMDRENVTFYVFWIKFVCE